LKTIIVNSGCQSFGIAAALQALYPQSRVFARPLPNQWESAEQEHDHAQQLAGADVWISSSHTTLAQTHLGAADPQILKAPLLGFAAFHPDLCYGYQRSTGALTRHHYNSAIALWAYRNHILPEDAARLFTARVYRDLGYFQQWGPSVTALREAFAACDLEAYFETFFLPIQRTGNFMHSCNHPRIHVLERLAKVLALRMGSNHAVLAQHVEVDDFLSQSMWPLYPEVAQSLSIPGGSYRWKIDVNTWLDGVPAYIVFAYTAYQQQGIAPEDLGMYNRDDALYDRVLTTALGHTA